MIAAWPGRSALWPLVSLKLCGCELKASEIQVAAVLEHAAGHPPIPRPDLCSPRQKNARVRSGFWHVFLTAFLH